MFGKQRFIVSGQLALVIVMMLGIQSVAYGQKNFTPKYKVEQCDCLGFSEDIPTFLSDLAGTQDLHIFGEGKSLKAAEKDAQNMCIETYRNFASVSKKEHPNNVTQSGCTKLKSTPNGEWVSI